MSCNENIPHLSIVPSKGSRQSTLDDSSEKCVLRTNNAMHNPSHGQSEHKFNGLADSTVGLSGNKLSSFFCPKLLVAASRSVDSVVLVKVVKLFWFSLVESREENWLWSSRLRPVMGVEHEKLSLCVKAARYMAAHTRLQRTRHAFIKFSVWPLHHYIVFFIE